MESRTSHGHVVVGFVDVEFVEFRFDVAPKRKWAESIEVDNFLHRAVGERSCGGDAAQTSHDDVLTSRERVDFRENSKRAGRRPEVGSVPVSRMVVDSPPGMTMA